MALTLEAEQMLRRVSLIEFFEGDIPTWRGLASQSYDFVRENFPAGATIRPDDVAKALTPLLEVSESLSNELGAKKLKQQYWRRYFGDLIIDRTWQDISRLDRRGRRR